jgi:putative phage-type endonuclease
MIYYNVEQNTPEWFDLKRGKFSASIFESLFMKETTKGYQDAIYKIVYERMTNDTPESYTNEWMQRGHEFEPEARSTYELETFNKVHNGGFFELSDWIGASPDGLIGEDGLIEIKCPKYNTMIGYLLDHEAPIKQYRYQLQGQLYVTGREWVDFVAYHPNLNPLIIRVERDEGLIMAINDKVHKSIEQVKEIITQLKGKL